MTHYVCVLIAILSSLFMSVACAEDIYRYVDDTGRVVYSSEKPVDNGEAKKVIIRQNSVSSMTAYEENESKPVVMYSASWCGVCKRARAYFEDQGIEYDEYDVENDPQGRRDYNRFGKSGVPIILIGDSRMNGFNKTRFQQMYSADN